MKTMKGPGIFLAQFVGPDAPFNSLPSIAKWAKEKGFIGVQIPTGRGVSVRSAQGAPKATPTATR